MGGVPELDYGSQTLRGFIPSRVLGEGRLLPLGEPEGLAPLADPRASLFAALSAAAFPPGGRGLGPYLAQGYRGGPVTIVVDDHTRPNAHTRMFLPWLLEWLMARGVDREAITLLVAGGTHRPPRPEEGPAILGEEVWRAWRGAVVTHDCDRGVTSVGSMADGTPVALNTAAVESEVIVPLTDLDYHYFAGVSGGPKQLIPGIAGRAIITREHLRMFDRRGFRPGVEMGRLEGNAVYEYKMEAMGILLRALRERGTLVYAITTVLNPDRRPVHLSSGDVVEGHREARRALDAVYVATLPRRADVVIVSARHLGINLYQAGKAIHAARRAVRPGGHILVLAPCQDGWGNDVFRDLMGLALPQLRRLRSLPVNPGGGEERRLVDDALAVVQAEVMRDFVIGKQKPVDLLVTLRHVGWGHLWLLGGGFSAEDRVRLPLALLDPGDDPSRELRRWIAEREAEGKHTYAVVNDPNLLLTVPGDGP